MDIKKTLFETTGIDPGTEVDIRRKMSESPFIKVIEYDLHLSLAEVETAQGASITVDDFIRNKGSTAIGIKAAIGILQRNKK